MQKQFDRFMNSMKEGGYYLLGVQIRRDGEVVHDWSRFAAKPRFESYSSSKTFAAVGVGIAIDEGLIHLDECISDSFREETYDVVNPNALSMTVRDLLTMSSGMSQAMFFRDGYERAHTRDWVRHIYKEGQFEHTPGTQFLYNNVNTYLLSCLVEKKSGKNLCEYLRYRLFEPLEIHNPDWTICPLGHTVAANGMAINTDEMGRFGQLLLNGGVFKGKRLVSEKFVQDMMSHHMTSTDFIPGDVPTPAGYGYQIWIDQQNDCAYLWGVFGQYCIILPNRNTVITITALQEDDGGSNGLYNPSPLRAKIWEELVIQR
ncbi:serine hydrolase domain-containing protein [Alcaligenes endophyticus]|uniref:Beta-lactamase family protein n=1 Tax=Alcaligenes endophyticus TaxID=1929088 RepID=A0ABT8EJP6_9BURK|nr:serine hydrolase domain-containing protein [Alcaligenes endophyticus]MCX5591839.1 serine hydrolase [Alcaligenes endophyticus]MDN4121516.1 beta-lactamase family protein [Alcaligenes endophyticus]